MSERDRACVLVADDDGEIREMISEFLSAAGFRAVLASDGEEVLPLALVHRPDLVLLDAIFPGTDGYTAATRLRGDARTRGIPVVMLTAQPEPVYRTLSARVGAVAHLTKPFSDRELLDTVHRAIAGRSS